MDQGLITAIGAIVGGTIPIGALTFALIRWIDGRHRKDMTALREDMKAIEGRLRDEVKAAEGRLRDEMKATEGRLRDEMKATEGRLRDEMKATEGRLQDEVTATEGRLGTRIDALEAGIDKVAERVVDVGDRLSRVEGVIEGALLTSRTQAAEAREGAA